MKGSLNFRLGLLSSLFCLLSTGSVYAAGSVSVAVTPLATATPQFALSASATATLTGFDTKKGKS
jgi:hypothetical protein